ncbi:MAG: gamma carbonic anhydrase family protein [Desulfobacteraceae bacterium]|nr:gamma carbonic anhydrase family protein [Desulfobacteraceae bacterium]MCB9494598.1 gamma carbonic anhydrase family protein [Desulfobacteraceae bacterium]
MILNSYGYFIFINIVRQTNYKVNKLNLVAFNKITPVINEKTFLAKGSIVIGNTTIGKNSSVWFNTVIRADMDKISIGENTNIQDNSVLHCDKGSPLTIGNNVTIGHNAVVHGCTVEDNVLIGMGATIMNNAVIKKGSIIAAGAVVLENTIIPEFSLAAGAPAKIKKNLDPAILELIKQSADHYSMLKDRYLELEK